MPSPWKRAMVKLSGEALMGDQTHGLDQPTLERIATDLAAAANLGVEIAVVVGGGNFFRGIQGADQGIDRARADSIGMLATVMNGLALEHAIEKAGHSARALSAVPMPYVCQPYSRQAALNHLNKGRVTVLAGGTGNPFFTTDTGAVLRARRIVGRCGDESDPGRWRLYGRPEAQPRRDALRHIDPRRGDCAQSRGHGPKCLYACPGQPDSDNRILCA